MNSKMDCYPYKSILCLNGRLEAVKHLKNLNNIPIVSADGAYEKLKKEGFRVEVIVGDFDSVDQLSIHEAVDKIYHSDQNKTDFEKSMEWIAQQKLFPCLVLGMFGGEVDHIFHNMAIFMKVATQGHEIAFWDIDENGVLKWGKPLLNSCSFETDEDVNISLLPFPEIHLSTQGLKWEISKKTFVLPFEASVRNRTKQPIIHVMVDSGKGILIMDAPFRQI